MDSETCMKKALKICVYCIWIYFKMKNKENVYPWTVQLCSYEYLVRKEVINSEKE